MPEGFFHSKSRYKKAAVYHNGKEIWGGKSFWPHDYPEEKAITECLNIIKNPNNRISGSKFKGITSDGIKVDIRVDEYGNMVSFFPSWEQ